jgi:hypothetical protein
MNYSKQKMKYLAIMSFAAIIAIFILQSFANKKSTKVKKEAPTLNASIGKKIQVAVLLDVSNSMDGLIEQTKSQLWTMVNTLGKAKCENVVPNLEIALYEYGRTSNDSKNGFVKQINSFITDLDSISENLFNLNTNGGEEYCGQVIYSSIDELPWSTSTDDYKVIFIAGNEDFLQGKKQYTEGCTKGKEKGIIVNTIYCGAYDEGVRLHWNLGSECGNGSYKNINSNAKDVYIPTPQDSLIYVLNQNLNNTYVGYGGLREMKKMKQSTQDNLNTTKSKKAGLDRAVAKANAAMYRNDDWDLVDADADGKYDWSNLDKNTLADSLRNKSTTEIKAIVNVKRTERQNIQQQINTLNQQRLAYITEYRKKASATNNEPTLESEMNQVLKTQAKRFNIIVE